MNEIQRPLLAWGGLAVLCSAVLLAGAGGKELHGTAVFYGSLSRAIAETGDATIIYRGEGAYLLKPPLLFWLTALSTKLLGYSDLAGSLVSRLFGFAVVALTYCIGRRLYDRVVAWFAVVVLVTNPTFHQFTTSLRMESLITTAMLMMVWGYLNRERNWSGYVFWSGAGLGLLAKGPAVLVALLFIVPHALATGRLGLRNRHWWLGLVGLLPGLAWYGYLFHLHGLQTVMDLAADTSRAGTSGIGNQVLSAVAEYLGKPALRFWPGLPFMLWGLWLGLFEMRRMRVDPVAADRAFLWFWFGINLLAISAKPDHDLRYLYPALPALAVLGGVACARLARQVINWRIPLAAGLAGLALWVAMDGLGLWVQNNGPALAVMRERVASELPVGAPVTVIGNGAPRLNPRRQSEHWDWVHYYLGREARVLEPQFGAISPDAFAADPFVLVARQDGRDALMRQLGLETEVETYEKRLARRTAQ